MIQKCLDVDTILILLSSLEAQYTKNMGQEINKTFQVEIDGIFNDLEQKMKTLPKEIKNLLFSHSVKNVVTIILLDNQKKIGGTSLIKYEKPAFFKYDKGYFGNDVKAILAIVFCLFVAIMVLRDIKMTVLQHASDAGLDLPYSDWQILLDHQNPDNHLFFRIFHLNTLQNITAILSNASTQKVFDQGLKMSGKILDQCTSKSGLLMTMINTYSNPIGSSKCVLDETAKFSTRLTEDLRDHSTRTLETVKHNIAFVHILLAGVFVPSVLYLNRRLGVSSRINAISDSILEYTPFNRTKRITSSGGKKRRYKKKTRKNKSKKYSHKNK